MVKVLISLSVLAAAATAGSVTELPESVTKLIDYSINPCDDIYRYACGAWYNDAVIPPDRHQVDTSFSKIYIENQAVLKTIFSSFDDNDSTKNALFGFRTPLSLSRSYYTIPSEWETVEADYKVYISTELQLAGYSAEQAEAAVPVIIRFEQTLAGVALSELEEMEAVVSPYTALTYSQLNQKYPLLVGSWLKANGFDVRDQCGGSNDWVGFYDLTYFDKAEVLLANTTLDNLRTIVEYKLIHASSNHLTPAFRTANWNLFGKKIYNETVKPSREKFCKYQTRKTVGDLLGQYFLDAVKSNNRNRCYFVGHVTYLQYSHFHWVIFDVHTAGAMASFPQRETSTLEDIHGALVAERSKKAYASGIRQVVKWIELTDQGGQLLHGDGIRIITATGEQSASVQDSGKKPLGYAAFDSLCHETIKAMDSGFQHLFVILSWNLMARSKSTETIQLSHFSYEEDAVGITFMKSKTAKRKKRRDPRHVYANPLRPHTCAFLALGLYLACNQTLAPGALLFESNAGSTGGPSLVSICLRCGWSLVSVFEHYMHYERAGDPICWPCGRGTAVEQCQIRFLPPHFKDTNSAAVLGAISATFLALADVAHLRGILAHALKAELVSTTPRLQPSSIPPYIESCWKEFSDYDRYKTDVTFQQMNVPAGAHKVEVSVVRNGFAIDCTKSYKGSVSDKTIFDENIDSHLANRATRTGETTPDDFEPGM
ncbi:hypothetical protein H257_18824 [Aphanomyces astaci]|uniref:Peptidase M13 N-terminal domain-containing protein n=1 Tax=Aphanomyces astaci TaxID=112090 RepID=W4FC27_APHAT|nr:hypothetical protein H257_18824 [Aphanomyces astaci]ETV64268.1 hypothetical protein H257_18824 [Aphanomyces astaci]|eukprot:XP_009846252.1 hypothetical protein H257_18824 [Aphanomyces astaci]